MRWKESTKTEIKTKTKQKWKMREEDKMDWVKAANKVGGG